MDMEVPVKKLFGVMPDGTPIEQYTLAKEEISCDVITYGGALRSLCVPNRMGTKTDVLLGFDHLEDYLVQDKFMGALIGRYANRIGGSRFELHEKTYLLAANDGPNHLHGGAVGFDKQVWTVTAAARDSLTLSHVSPDGQEGYPGNLQVRVTYRLERGGLSIAYWAKSDRDTLCNLTNHAYFNLDGYDGGSILDQHIQIFADDYTPTDARSIPSGAVSPVDGTPMDFREMTLIGKRIDEEFDQLRYAGGYDHNWIVRGTGLRPAALAWSEKTGIRMEVLTTHPGIQFYSGNYLDGCPNGKNGQPITKRYGFCLETQYYPDSPHHPEFPSAVLKADTDYRQMTVYRFSHDKK